MLQRLRRFSPPPFVRLALAAALLAACGPNKDPLGKTSVTSLDSAGDQGDQGDQGAASSGDTSASVTDDGGTDTSGSGVHGDCDEYLACIGAVLPDQLPQAEMTYGADGVCWENGAEMMKACTDACTAGLQALGLTFPDEPKCGGSPDPTATDPTVDPTTDPTVSGTTFEDSATSDSTTNASVSTSSASITTDPQTTGDTGGGDHGNCGWDAANKWYGCTGVPGLEDPDGISPIDCPGDPQVGDACSEDGPISGVGCCLANGDNYYCARGTVQLESCG